MPAPKGKKHKLAETEIQTDLEKQDHIRRLIKACLACDSAFTEACVALAAPRAPLLCGVHMKVRLHGFIYLTEEQFGQQYRSDMEFQNRVKMGVKKLADDLLISHMRATVTAFEGCSQICEQKYGAWDRPAFHGKFEYLPEQLGAQGGDPSIHR